MMQDMIHDALNLIDDDMIESVEALRVAASNKKKYFKVYRFNTSIAAVAAACFVILIAASLVGNSLIKESGTTDRDGADGYLVGGTTGGAPLTENSGTELPREEVVVKIVKVQAGGFVAIALDDSGMGELRSEGGAGLYPESVEVLNIVYSENTEFVEDIELNVGKIVKIEYSNTEAGEIMAYRIMSEDYDNN